MARLSGTNIVQNAFHQTNDIVDGGGVELIVEFSVAHYSTKFRGTTSIIAKVVPNRAMKGRCSRRTQSESG